ncbi:unnamed protein product, partial [Discosporangium mesarthrocarpum]
GALGAWYWFRNSSRAPPFSTKGNSMAGRVCIVTGANTGVGKATAEALAQNGASVILACRSPDKVCFAQACEDIRTKIPGAEVDTMKLDLESNDSIRDFAAKFQKSRLPLHVLVNNAGLMVKEEESVRGMEKTMVVNHLGPFLLTHLLLPSLQRSAAAEGGVGDGQGLASRIVNVTSRLEKRGRLLAFDRGIPPGPAWFSPPSSAEKGGGDRYDVWRAYSDSKLCNLLFTFELHRRLSALQGGGEGRVTVNAMSPGVVNSDLSRWASPLLLWAARPLMSLFMRTPAKGAETAVYAAVSPEMEGVSGRFLGDLKEAACSESSKDKVLAQKLWDASEAATGVAESERIS